MACKLISVNDKPDTPSKKEFIVSTPEDVKFLPRYGIKGLFNDPNNITANAPCSFGSTALVTSTSDVYILSPDNEWVKI